MVRKLLLSIASIFIATVAAFSQGAIKGKLIDKNTKEGIPFANVVALVNGSLVAGANSDINGEFIIKPLNPGKYDLKATFVGYQPQQVNGVTVSVDKTTYQNLELSTGVQLTGVNIVDFKEPLIDPDTKSGGTITREEFQAMPSKNINSVAATTAGVYQADEGKTLNMRGQRDQGTSYYVDGQKVIGGNALPQASVEQVSVITGGLPAAYGDVTGGVVSITTRGPQSEYFGSVEAISSQFLDKYGYNFIGFSVGGPILLKKDTAHTGVKNSILGFIISGETSYDKDPSPSSIGMYKVNDAKLHNIEQNPLRPAANGSGFVPNTNFVTKGDLEHIDARQNVAQKLFSLNAKIDFKASPSVNFTLGGALEYNNNHSFIYEYALFNPVNNPQVISTTYRVFARVTQKFGGDGVDSKDAKEKSASNIQNAYYTIQAGYNSSHTVTQSDVHKDNFFDYGYYGNFHQYKARSFSPTLDTVTVNGQVIRAYKQSGYSDSLLTYAPSDLNPLASNYTTQYYNYVGAQKVRTGSDVQSGQALLNGDRPSNVYSLWYNTGRQYPGFNMVDKNQTTLRANFSADVFKNHAIQVGFEYDQRSESQFNINAIGLWTLMRQLANFHLQQMDKGHPIDVPGGTYDYIYYDRYYNANQQTQFDKSFRAKNGMAQNSTNWIDVDSYAPSTYSLKMFSADDLLNSGNSYVTYYGYDYTGQKSNNTASLNDFFTKQDASGNFSRLIPAYRPIYMAGYVQDKFDFRDIKFNIGLRIDRYDANQLTLKDKYLFQEAKTAGEVGANEFYGQSRPSNIGSDYVVYVNSVQSPTAIVGYRNGDTWYDSKGTVVQDPKSLAIASQSGNITPYLVNPNQKGVALNAFTSYVPQVNFMPRIAFAFPISEQANFFAHYDVLTQRPTQAGINGNDPINRLNPTDYLFLESVQGNILHNPGLKPERTTDYELGFTQVLSEKKNSSITISAFYREMRDMIQIVKVNYAYPVSYLSWGNLDFGTVKGFTAAYDLRRINGVALTASYTLQFADGTGSGVADGINLVNSGLPNLRTTIPLDFDQRHAIMVNVDYRFGSGGSYHGPVWTKGDKTYKILNNVGANLVAHLGSGTPYSAEASATPEAQVALGVAGRSTLLGSVNGSRNPWNYRMDLRVDKNIELSWGGKKEGNQKKAAVLNVYVMVLNILNTQNILKVYRYTGNANDDGYTSDAAAQTVINSQASAQSFRDLYSLKINNPANYSLPRRIRLGLQLSF
jgi:hypothetical protein